jgi:hypothetical protein
MAEMPRYMNRVTGWDLVVKAYSANEVDLSFYRPKHEKLMILRDRFRDLTAERAALTARKLEVTKEMRGLFQEGETLADALRTTAREHYGLNSEKLVEFGMQPNRPRSRNSPLNGSKKRAAAHRADSEAATPAIPAEIEPVPDLDSEK